MAAADVTAVAGVAAVKALGMEGGAGGRLIAEGTLEELRGRFGKERASLEEMFLAIVE